MSQINLSNKLRLIILAAILLPVMLLGSTSFLSARTIATNNLEAFVSESGSWRLEAIEKEFNTVALTMDEFMSRRQDMMVRILRDRSDGTVTTRQDTLENTVKRVFETDLVSSGYFNTVSLITNDGLQASRLRPFAMAGTVLNYDPDNSSAIRDASKNLQDPAATTITVVITNHNEQIHVEILQSIFIEGSDSLVGYLLADMNLQTVVYNNLSREEEPFNTYAYLLFPFNNTVLTAPQVDKNLIDVNSSGANRIRLEQTGSGSYFVNPESGNRREVLGYSGIAKTSLITFGIVTEVNTAVVTQQLLSETLARIFILVVGATGILTILLLWYTNQQVIPPLKRIRQAILSLVRGEFDEPVPDMARSDEIGALANSFVDMRHYIRNLIEDMNRQLRERTRDVQVTQGIGRAITAEHNVQNLMDRVVQLIVDNFPSIYHAQIFLIDKVTEFAVLRASTGAAGQALLSRGHKLAVGSVSVIGQVTEQGHVVVARDAAESNVHRRNEFLQETLAELAIPLRLGNQIIGALDVQSKERDAFDADQVSALQTLADQVTIAIENARLYAESERLLANIELERNAATRRNWQQLLYEQRQAELKKLAGKATNYDFSALNHAVYQNAKTVIGDKTEHDTIPFVVPIILRGQVLGVVEYELPQAEFSFDKVLLAEELVTRMSIGLENARLFQTSQQAVERERVVNEISAKLTGQTDIDAILQTAIREIGQALRTPQVAIRLKSHESNGTSNGNSNGTSKNQSPS